MSKTGVLGVGLIGLGAVFAYFHDTFNGMLGASVCLIVGLAMIVASEVQGLVSKPNGADANSKGRKPARVLILVKGEVHTYPHRDGRFQEMADPKQTDLEFDVFIQCWLLLVAEMTLRITDLRLTLRGAHGSIRVGEQVKGDLNSWQLRYGGGHEQESGWAIVPPRKTPASLTEMDTAAPLECGAPREGWLHFRIRNTTPSELRDGSLEFSVEDFFSDVHVAVASRILLPGRVSPIPASAPSEVEAKKDDEHPNDDTKLAARSDPGQIKVS
jgi:hypothetical protein